MANYHRKFLKCSKAPHFFPQVTTDKKSLAYVDNMLKKSNKKVEELHQELQELNAHIVVKDPEELLGNNRKTTELSVFSKY